MSDQNPPTSIGRFVGLILVGIGMLWLVLTGLCSAAFLIGFLGEGNLSDVGVVFAIGLPSAFIGVAIYAIGRALRPS